MTRQNILSAVLFVFAFAFFPHTSDLTASPQHNLTEYLPKKCEMQGWERDGSPQEYREDELYEYINGGAEIYHEYGFTQVFVQDFKSKSGKALSLEIFEMEDAESAYGIYTFKTSAEDKRLVLGSDAQLADYYLNFWKGNLLVTITGFDEDQETIKALQELAKAVDAKIKAQGGRPHLASVLPERGLRTTSIKYFQGNLGLYNSYPFFTRDTFHLKEGIKGDYEGGYSVYIIESKEGEGGESAYDEVKKSFEESPKYRKFELLERNLFRIQDRKGKQIFVSSFKNCALIVMGAVHPTQAKEVFSDIQENIGK